MNLSFGCDEYGHRVRVQARTHATCDTTYHALPSHPGKPAVVTHAAEVINPGRRRRKRRNRKRQKVTDIIVPMLSIFIEYRDDVIP